MPDIFGQDNPVEVAKAEDLVGEGKKFKDVDALAAGKAEADRYIEQLKSELAETRKQAEAKTASEAELTRLREEFAEIKKAQEVRQPAQPVPASKDIEKIVEETITRTERLKTETQNIKEANRTMTDHFGDPQKAGAAVATRAEELGLSTDDLRGIAARSPGAFKRLMLGDAPLDRDPVLNVSTAIPAVAGQTVSGPRAGTKEFYQDILRTNPRRYYDPKTQAQILKDTIAGTYVP